MGRRCLEVINDYDKCGVRRENNLLKLVGEGRAEAVCECCGGQGGGLILVGLVLGERVQFGPQPVDGR